MSFFDDVGIRPAFRDLFGDKATDIVSGLFNSAGDAFVNPDDGTIDVARVLGLGGGIANLLGLFGDNKPPVVGYQGGIPRYQAVRSEVAGMPDPNRRPGSTPQRSFSDVVYAQRPDTPVPSVAEAQARTDQQAAQLAQRNQSYAEGGIASIKPNGYYLGGMTDGMADRVPASINGQQQAALSDGEFVVPADVVSHLGNGNSNAGAKELYDMMERIRKMRTGNPQQGKQINPKRQLPV